MEELGPTEYVIFERIQANWLRGFEGVGGKLFLTNERLVFIPHGLNFQTEWVQIEIWAMTKIEKSATWGLIPNGITVTLDSGHVFKFVVWNRSKIIKEIVQAKRINNEIM
ncbi:GRAM domain-containing protein [Paenibacillus taichungensis]|uniref:GRAM domain-containing protein n=1 Tax=Paenibacillus taichungensis TaxID=484184 RepID=UPI0039A66DAA